MALILSAFVLYTRWDDSRRSEPPRIERTVLASGAPPAGITPEVSVLLARRGDLHLSAQQVGALTRLQAEWQRVSTADRESAGRAAAEFRSWMAQAGKRGRVAMADIQQHGAELSAVSARIARRQRVYWESALRLLTGKQRKQAVRLPFLLPKVSPP